MVTVKYRNAITDEVLYVHELEDKYAEDLDDIYGTVQVAGYDYETSRVLRCADPIAFREGFLNWIDSQWEAVEDDE